jgi:flagellar motor switch protein FliG
MAIGTMGMTGVRKAAMLLMSLDAPTAAELLKGVAPEIVTNIAVELAYLDASGVKVREQSHHVVREFCSSLKKRGDGFEIKVFLSKMLETSVGAKRAAEIQSQIGELLKKRDPFLQIRQTDSARLSAALEGEHPQAVGMVLAELDQKKSGEVLSKLSETLRIKTIKRMTHPEALSADAKVRIAILVLGRIEGQSGGAAAAVAVETPDQTNATLRKVALVLRGLAKELRDGLVASIKESDEATAAAVMELMVTWDDITLIPDRPLQEALRGLDSQKLAKALLGADEAITAKVRANISERARSLLDEETSLLSSPKKEEIAAARDVLVAALRAMNEKGEISFE